MRIFDFKNYLDFLQDYLKHQPKRGHGLLTQWAHELGVSTTLLSQIVKGNKLLTLEVADGLASVLKLASSETDYFFLLVQLEQSGTAKLKDHFKKKIEQAQLASRHMKNRIQNVTELSPAARAEYYSSWTFSGVRNLAACPNMNSIEAIAARLHLPRAAVLEIVEFLLKHALMIQDAKGFKPGVVSTYISSDSPLAAKHHQNWRLKSISQMDSRCEEDLFYTSPMSLSADVAKRLRQELVDYIEELHKKTDPSPSEITRCLNIDWFEY